jgi:hypothetical protein
MRALIDMPQKVAMKGSSLEQDFNPYGLTEGARPYSGGPTQQGWKDGVRGGEWLGGRQMTIHDMTPKLIQQRIRQIEYDRRLSGHKVDGKYPPNGELSALRTRLKELGGK